MGKGHAQRWVKCRKEEEEEKEEEAEKTVGKK